TRGTVVATVAGSGAVVADSASNVGFRTSGRVAEIYVQVGDQVQAGQQLARLDTQDLQAQLLQARGALADAQAKLQTVQNGAGWEDVAASQAALAQAEATLAGLEQGRQEDVVLAQAALDGATAKLQSMEDQGRPEAVATAQAAVDSARAKLD